MPYTHFRYIAYQVPTVGHDGKNQNIYGIPPGNIANPQVELDGDVLLLNQDAKTRIQRLMDVMYEARCWLTFDPADDNQSTLKIFMAPEFYFRPNNQELSYDQKVYKAIKDVLRNTIGNKFPDWLVIPGTIMCNRKERPDVFFNTSLYIHKSSKKQIIEKAQCSDIDGIPQGPGITAPEFFPEYNTEIKKCKHRFKINGITCGLEICFEHILNTYQPSNQPYGLLRELCYSNPPQLHLLTGCGMYIKPTSVTTTFPGYILRNDGICHIIPPYNYTELMMVNGYETDNITAKLISFQKDLDLPVPYPLCLGTPPGADHQSWDNHPQRIKIYPKLRLLSETFVNF
ncbi:MAG: hypothetical protein F6K31_02485 [Symploca sp. SIO2G7]|nr:hypothetical protein [Symploca sp. SIO2G7]